MESQRFRRAFNTVKTTVTDTSGKVYLVGAGPGDPGLITVRGAECLRRADLVLYDYLVDPRVLHHVPPSAERICLGSHATGRIMSQDEVNRRMIEAALNGNTVVRLKGGDPTLFARAAEELTALKAANVPFEIVPGVSAALAIGSYAGIPLTSRESSSCVALITGQESPQKSQRPLRYDALAGFPGTLVFYMGVTSAPAWSQSLLQGGMSAATPVAIVRHLSLPEQQVWHTTLGEVADRIIAEGIRPPALVVVGDVAATRDVGWFYRRPLFGRTVLVTRPAHQAAGMEEALAELGARVLLQPAIAIGPPRDWTPVDEAIEHIGDCDWIVFSSANGVERFLGRLVERGRDLRALGRAKLAAIGPATAQALQERGLIADVSPDEFRAENLADALTGHAAGKRFLLIRASRGREVLAQSLAAAGAAVQQVAVYESRDVAAPDPAVVAELRAGRVDWVTITSSAIARSVVNLFGDSLRNAKLAAISPLTDQTLRELSFVADAIAETYTTDGLVQAILRSAEGRDTPRPVG
jgi:uroporphyrinogen III methyltransferase/synthase